MTKVLSPPCSHPNSSGVMPLRWKFYNQKVAFHSSLSIWLANFVGLGVFGGEKMTCVTQVAHFDTLSPIEPMMIPTVTSANVQLYYWVECLVNQLAHFPLKGCLWGLFEQFCLHTCPLTEFCLHIVPISEVSQSKRCITLPPCHFVH